MVAGRPELHPYESEGTTLPQRARIAIVTGAASGIGFATAQRLAADGWRLALVDVDEARLVEKTRAVEGATAYPFDLLEAARFSDVVDRVTNDLGPQSLLVNDAGVGVAAPLLETTPEEWDRIIAINLTAMFHTCRAVLPEMLDAGHGMIVNVASIAGVVGIKNRLAYTASKHGVVGLTRAIAADYAHLGIRCNAICPGTVDTEWIGKILADAPDPEATRKQMEQRQLDGRMGTPDEVAAGIAFLASDDARFVNGAAFMMDGGVTAV
jgi:NAD(P)-dependent dehydrogenase (short-subunit alcohol dehydrogenase family)